MAKMKITIGFAEHGKVTKEDIESRDKLYQLIKLLSDYADCDAIIQKDPYEVIDLLEHSDNRPKYVYQISGILAHKYKINTLDDFVKLSEEDINDMEFGPKTKETLNEILTETKERMGTQNSD